VAFIRENWKTAAERISERGLRPWLAFIKRTGGRPLSGFMRKERRGFAPGCLHREKFERRSRGSEAAPPARAATKPTSPLDKYHCPNSEQEERHMRPINEIYNDLYDVGVVNSQREMSLLMGKRPSWFSSSKTRKRHPTLDSLVCGYVAISDIHRQAMDAMKAAQDDEEMEDIAACLETISRVTAEIWVEISTMAKKRSVAVWPAS
jgi:hypothetical protein